MVTAFWLSDWFIHTSDLITFITTTKAKISTIRWKSFLLLNNQDRLLFIWHEHIQTYQVAYASKLGKMDKDGQCFHFHNSKHAGCATYKVLTGNYYHILGYQNILPLIAT